MFSVLMGITWLPAQLVHLDPTAGQYTTHMDITLDRDVDVFWLF